MYTEGLDNMNIGPASTFRWSGLERYGSIWIYIDLGYVLMARKSMMQSHEPPPNPILVGQSGAELRMMVSHVGSQGVWKT